MINLTVGIRRPTHLIKLTRVVKKDIALWLEFLKNYNSKSFFLNFNWLSSRTLDLYMDASGSLGYGAVFGQHWFYGPWPSKRTSKRVRLICGTADRGTAEPAELVEPAEPREMTVFITTIQLNYYQF